MRMDTLDKDHLNIISRESDQESHYDTEHKSKIIVKEEIEKRNLYHHDTYENLNYDNLE